MIIGERLKAIANRVPQNARLADIGTDHAYLPAYLVQTGRISFAIAGEVHEGPFHSAQNMIDRFNLQEQIRVRFGDGLAVLTPGEVDTLVIAGMGGATIVEIVSARLEVVDQLQRIILQPMIAAALVRQWLVQEGWLIVDETLVEDDNRLYEIIVAEPGAKGELTEILAEVGPTLWERKPPLLARHIGQLIRQKQQVLSEMSVSEEARQSVKYRDYQDKLKQLEAMVCQLA